MPRVGVCGVSAGLEKNSACATEYQVPGVHYKSANRTERSTSAACAAVNGFFRAQGMGSMGMARRLHFDGRSPAWMPRPETAPSLAQPLDGCECGTLQRPDDSAPGHESGFPDLQLVAASCVAMGQRMQPGPVARCHRATARWSDGIIRDDYSSDCLPSRRVVGRQCNSKRFLSAQRLGLRYSYSLGSQNIDTKCHCRYCTLLYIIHGHG